MIFKRKIQFNYNNSIIFMFLILLLANSIEAQRKIGIAQLKARSSWYTCSAKNTNYIAYNLTVIPDNIASTPNFGSYAPGWPLQFQGPPGVIVLATNSTEMIDYLNPGGTIAWYYSNVSCVDKPVTSCIKATTDKRLSNNTVQCLAVTNPNDHSTTCIIDINFNVPFGSDTNNVINSDMTNISPTKNLATTNVPIISLIYFTTIFWTFIFIYIENNF